MGNAPAGGFTTPSAALGKPARVTGLPFSPGTVTPFAPAWTPADVVSIGTGGSLTLALDQPATDDPLHPHGVDLIVFGNSFFTDALPPWGMVGALVADGGVIELSDDGVSWHAVPGAEADGLWPTLGFRDVGPYDAQAGLEPTDFRVAIDPALTVAHVVGADWIALLEQYGESGGGLGIDLAWAGLTTAQFVRISVPVSHPWHVEVDAVARVHDAGAPSADLDGDGVIGGGDLALLLGAFGTGAAGDANGDGETDGEDLAILLGAWS